jgi:nematocidal protein AidA
MSEVILRSDPAKIDILTVIDTEAIKSYWNKSDPSRTPSQEKGTPTGLDHSNKYMICTGSRGIISGQGTGDLSFKAYVEDSVRFVGVSAYDNADDAVIIYNIKKFKGDDVFNQFNSNVYVRKEAVQPDPNSPSRDGLPALHVPTNFATFEASVRQSGTEFFGVCFALYTLSDNRQRQDLYGYFWWDPTITVA